MNKRAQYLINELELSPHPEGGFYKEMFRSGNMLNSPIHSETRNAVTDIYFLLAKGQVSRFHKVLHDELWNFYEGDPLELIEIKSDSLDVSNIVIGNNNGVPKYKHCIQSNNWQAAWTTGEYSLVGCTVAPGFDFSDFTFLTKEEKLYSTIQQSHPELEKFL